MNKIPAKYVKGAEWVSTKSMYDTPHWTLYIGSVRTCEVEEIKGTGAYICDVIEPKVDCLNIQAESLENARDTAEMRYLLCVGPHG